MQLLIKNNGDSMQKYSDEWARRLRELLQKHNLTYRGADKFTDSVVSYGTINSWGKEGRLPNYEDARDFLGYFPEERIELMRVVGHPIPPEWMEAMELAEAMRYALSPRTDLTDDEKEVAIKGAQAALERARRSEDGG